MTCSRCTAEAVVKRGNTAYCAKCALIRDWEEIIQIVQEDRIAMGPNLDFPASAPAAAKKKTAGAKAAPAEDEAPNGQAGASTKEKAATGARAKGDPSGNGSSLPADPFA